jgi:hypothetical protein
VAQSKECESLDPFQPHLVARLFSIREPWIGMIMDGSKTWELRTQHSSAADFIQLRRIRNCAAESSFLPHCDVHSVSPNLTQADGGMRNDKPRLLRPIDHNPAQQPGLLKLA